MPKPGSGRQMSSAGNGMSCSPASCNLVDNPDRDDVTFDMPLNDMQMCTDDAENSSTTCSRRK